MYPKQAMWLTVMMSALALAGCQKKEEPKAAEVPVAPVPPPEPPKPQPTTIEVVKTDERSRHFLAVTRELELGGTLYAYADIDGDMRKLAGSLQEILQNMAEAQPALKPYAKDYTPILATLGFDGVKAVGLSSVPDGTGFFRNRVFFYTPEARTGLLAGLGGAPAPFARLGLAPADTDFYAEAELDLAEVYTTIHKVVQQVAGEEPASKIQAALQSAGQEAAFSLLRVIQDWKGHSAMVLRMDPESDWMLPGTEFKVPAFSLLLALDGLAPALQPALDQSPLFNARKAGDRQVYELKEALPWEGIKPVLVIEGSTLYFATSGAFYDECRNNQKGLATRPEFQQALAQVGNEGNGLTYVTPRFFARWRELDRLNPQLTTDKMRGLQFALSRLPQPDRPLAAVRINQANGILVRSYLNRSLKQDMAAVAVYNPVTIGVMAAMAVPAFQKVRQSSQEKAVLNNLRQLGSAADQFYLENGVTTARYDDLVGPDKYIRAITPVAGENYRTLVFKQGRPLRVVVPSLRKTVEYNP